MNDEKISYHKKKRIQYQQEYVLPCFELAKAEGIDLNQLVKDNPGKNCVRLLIERLIDKSKIQSIHGDDHSWIITFSGKQFWPLDPHIDDINIIDIAHALSLLCRYAGHCKSFYSVADHSIRCAYIGIDKYPKKLSRTILLHDAAEAYINDIARPIKPYLTNYKKIEDKLEKVIAEKFDLIYPFPPEIKIVDNILLATERRDLMSTLSNKVWNTYGQEPLEERIIPMTIELAEQQFLTMFDKLK